MTGKKIHIRCIKIISNTLKVIEERDGMGQRGKGEGGVTIVRSQLEHEISDKRNMR